MPNATNREIEIKLRVSDLPTVVRRIRDLGASFRGRVFEQNTIYDTPASDLRNSGRLLRVRLETPAPGSASVYDGRPLCSRARPRRGILTSKAPPHPGGGGFTRPHYKERLEREVEIRNPGLWPHALRSLGLRPSFSYEKFRSTFELRGLYLDLDETPVGIFLELEGSPRTIDSVARALGYTLRNYFRGTYWDVYAADCRRRSRPIRNMVFPS
jgi:adenylate cyclase class 2